MAQKILTVPEVVEEEMSFYPVGNEWIALPELNQLGQVESFNVISEQHKGMLEFRGGEQPILAPALTVDGAAQKFTCLHWTRLEDWIPQFELSGAGWKLVGTVFCPNGFRGFIYLLAITNTSPQPRQFTLGWQGNWQATMFTAFSTRPSLGQNTAWYNRWTRTLTFEHRAGVPLAGWAVGLSEPLTQCQWSIRGDQAEGEKRAAAGDPLHFSLGNTVELEPRATYKLALYLATNREADGASTCVIDLQRRGWQSLLDHHRTWLQKHRPIREERGRAGYLCNLNGFFSYFFARAKCFDTENTVLMTTRSPRYYVSAAFWARDAYLWSFPGVLHIDSAAAREYLTLGLTRYWRNLPNHALYIDGTDLYPGFELDELCSWFIALGQYLQDTEDWEFVDSQVLTACTDFLRRLIPWCGDLGLYKTFLSPTDDPVEYPYLTYNNALLCTALEVIAAVFERTGQAERAAEVLAQRAALHKCIQEVCITTGPFGPMYAWAVNDQGEAQLLDQPPGSLQLLAYYGFCDLDDPVYRNTAAWIHSTHNPDYVTGSFAAPACEHAPYPWVLSLCYELISGSRAQALQKLLAAKLDNDIACETIDPHTGAIKTGAAFATCAGFLSHSLFVALQTAESR